jgi:hypothetical protein
MYFNTLARLSTKIWRDRRRHSWEASDKRKEWKKKERKRQKKVFQKHGFRIGSLLGNCERVKITTGCPKRPALGGNRMCAIRSKALLILII